MGKKKESLLNFTAEMISAEGLLEIGDNVLVCVSGGADSVALLHNLFTLQKQFGLTIGVAHLNHELRGDESTRDSIFVEKLAENLEIPLHLKSQDVKIYQQEHRLSLEDAARQVRYHFFYETAEKNGYSKIATAHTANDNAELILMNLFRGSGPSGLSGIPVRRGIIIRPFLKTSREDIIKYLGDNHLDYVSDSSNMSRDYLRNRVRLDLLPLIKKEYNKNIIDCLNRTGNILKEEETWIDSLVLPVFNRIVTDQQDESISLSLQQLTPLPLAAKRRIIRKAIGCIKGDLKRITLFHTDIVAEMADNIKPVLSADLPDRIQVQKKGSCLIITRHNVNLRTLKKATVLYAYQLDRLEKNVTIVSLPAISKRMLFTIQDNNNIDYSNKNAAWLDMSCLRFPLTIRNLRPNDKLSPLGMTGSQTLKKFFSGISVSGNDRDKCPLLVSDTDIIWVGGHRIDNRYKLKPDTEKILKVELLLD